MNRYDIRVQITPQLHNGYMQYLWQIVRVDNDGSTWTVAHGWTRTIHEATAHARTEAHQRGLVK